MRTTVLALHGFTLNAAEMRAGLGALEARLAEHADVVCLNAPHACSEASVNRLYQRFGGQRRPPPHLSWWNAADDGKVYQGWETSRDQLRAALARHSPALLLGFSQGAMVAATMAALRETPVPVVLIAGGIPRAEALAPLFTEPINVPALHVWGERDPLKAGAVALAERFDPGVVVTWPGSHSIPQHGPAADAIIDFVRRHSSPR